LDPTSYPDNLLRGHRLIGSTMSVHLAKITRYQLMNPKEKG